MQQGAPRNRTRGRRQGPQRQPEADRQEPHLIRCPLSLPISTRAIGMAVGRYMMELRDDLLNFSSSDDEVDEGYLERNIPNWYQLYRRCLALFESKLVRVQRSCWPRFSGYVDHSFHGIGMSVESYKDRYPKHVTDIVNALGIVRHGDLTFVPVVAEEFYDNNGKLVPLPQSLLYSNLRRAVVALADPKTPEPYRIEFEAYCPIPGAIWEDHLLKNADEIMPGDHGIDNDIEALFRGPGLLRGKLNDNITGKISALVNINKTTEFKMPPRKVGESLLDYRAGMCRIFDCSDICTTRSFAKLTDEQVKEGLDLMFGEVPNNANHKSALYATREKRVSAFSYGGFAENLTLSISTRGIGFYLARFLLQNQTLLKRVKLNIHTTYRAFLGLLETKMKPDLFRSREFYKSSFISTIYWYNTMFYVPEPIAKIISAVGNITIGQQTFIMGMPKERLDENGKLIPEPQNLLISNLRRTVEALSDPETPLQHREHFEQNCPIPGAIWVKHLLTNADEIIPANYSAKNLEADILAWAMCTNELRGRVFPPLTELTLNHEEILGKRSAFVSVTMEHPMRVEPRQPGQELASYVPSFRSTPSPLACRSFVWLNRDETTEGQTLMLGEWPKGETRQVYALRDPLVCGFEAVQKWNFGNRY